VSPVVVSVIFAALPVTVGIAAPGSAASGSSVIIFFLIWRRGVQRSAVRVKAAAAVASIAGIPSFQRDIGLLL